MKSLSSEQNTEPGPISSAGDGGISQQAELVNGHATTVAESGSAKNEADDTGATGSSATEVNKAAAAHSAIRNLNAGLGETVAMLLRDPKYRHLSLHDLEWLVLPPLAANQVLTMRGKVKDKDGKENGLTVPLCLALWARVSDEVDQKLETQKKAGAPLRLAPQDWMSGKIPWLVLYAGPEELMSALEKKLSTALNDRLRVYFR